MLQVFIVTDIVLSIVIIGLICAVMYMRSRIHGIERTLIDTTGDYIDGARSVQDCLNQVVDVINAHSEELKKHSSAIDYITKEISQ